MPTWLMQEQRLAQVQTNQSVNYCCSTTVNITLSVLRYQEKGNTFCSNTGTATPTAAKKEDMA